MSERITRRTFLKVSGTAVLAAAAGGMLAGCGDGADDLLNVSTLPSVSEQNLGMCDSNKYYIGMGAFEGCRSNSQRESSGVQHYYLYTAVTFRDVLNAFPLNASDFKFTFTNTKLPQNKSASSIANYTLDSSNKYKATTSRTINTPTSTTIPLWIDLGPYFDIPTSNIGGFTVTYKDVIFRYASPSDTSSYPQDIK